MALYRIRLLSSPLWFRCSIWVRVFFALLFVAMAVGAYYVDRTFQRVLGPFAYMTPTWGYITFLEVIWHSHSRCCSSATVIQGFVHSCSRGNQMTATPNLSHPFE